jgi:hypothetical protein
MRPAILGRGPRDHCSSRGAVLPTAPRFFCLLVGLAHVTLRAQGVDKDFDEGIRADHRADFVARRGVGADGTTRRRSRPSPFPSVPPAISSCSPRAFSPLDRFMGKADFERVVEEMRLASASEILTG